RSVGPGRRGRVVAAKNAITGSCPAMSSCQRWAAAPSSASRAVPNMAMWPTTMARATSDMARGIHAVGGNSRRKDLHTSRIELDGVRELEVSSEADNEGHFVYLLAHMI